VSAPKTHRLHHHQIINRRPFIERRCLFRLVFQPLRTIPRENYPRDRSPLTGRMALDSPDLPEAEPMALLSLNDQQRGELELIVSHPSGQGMISSPGAPLARRGVRRRRGRRVAWYQPTDGLQLGEPVSRSGRTGVEDAALRRDSARASTSGRRHHRRTDRRGD
jgi:hypothetical protein